MVKCGICGETLKRNTDKLVACHHHKAMVHYGCCADNCSWHGAPCKHASGIYRKIDE